MCSKGSEARDVSDCKQKYEKDINGKKEGRHAIGLANRSRFTPLMGANALRKAAYLVVIIVGDQRSRSILDQKVIVGLKRHLRVEF